MQQHKPDIIRWVLISLWVVQAGGGWWAFGVLVTYSAWWWLLLPLPLLTSFLLSQVSEWGLLGGILPLLLAQVTPICAWVVVGQGLPLVVTGGAIGALVVVAFLGGIIQALR
ncbi:MAG: hypothetical protein HC876_01090 [Chloroflexaceae bacterium]|nr:hypothetical protein [Chloroflexaceae bacterium]NJO04230.1 hypothetical protein [Chloroflexaceae bacterium]